jgi:hypothetical protein
LLLLLLSLAGVLCLAGLLWLQGVINTPAARFIPVNVHSVRQADYRANPNFSPIQRVRLDIIWDILFDREPGAADLAARQAALLNSLQTPVAFVTPTACQGVHLLYPDQDTWIDSAHPAARHGNEASLQLSRNDNRQTRLLLHFNLYEAILPGTTISHARLELSPAAQSTSIAPPIRLFNLAGSFSETATHWANQPEPGQEYRATSWATPNGHAWEVTDLVRDWLLGRYANYGLMIELPPPADAFHTYYSNQASSQNTQINPRLVIDCENPLPRPQLLTAATATPPLPATPRPPDLTTPLPEASPPFAQATTTPAPLTPIVPSATPATPIAPSPTPIIPTGTPVVPTAIPLIPTATPVTPSATPLIPTGTPVGPTATPILPSATPIIPTATSAPTDTPIPPSPTSPPSTSAPPSTATTPPTATATPTETATVTPTFTPTSTSTPAGICSSPSLILTPAADTTLRDNQPDDNFGTDSTLLTKPPSNPRNTLIQFDLSVIPPGTPIVCANLRLNQISSLEIGQTIQIHRVTAAWVESQATWNNRTTGVAWINPGGDFDSAVAASFVPNATNHIINLTSLTQNWVDTPAANSGLLMEVLAVGPNTEHQFSSREGANPPQLVIQY